MKLILQADVKDQGKRGDLVDVSDGYARNFLLPRKLAVVATADALNAYNSKEAAKVHQKKVDKENAKALAETLSNTVIKVSAKGGSAGRLFGSITAKEISDALMEQYKIQLDKHKIVLKEPLKTAGQHTVPVKLGHETTANMIIEVIVI